MNTAHIRKRASIRSSASKVGNLQESGPGEGPVRPYPGCCRREPVPCGCRPVPLGRKCGRYGCGNFRNLVVSQRRFIFAVAKILDHAILGWTYLFRSTVRRGARLHACACSLVQRLYLTDVSRPLPHSSRVAAASSFQFIHFVSRPL